MIIPTNICLGNCWMKAYSLSKRLGGEVRYFNTHTARCGSKHYFCQLPSGEAWHFKVQRDILPWPLSGLLFLGRYECLTNDNRKNKEVNHALKR